MIEPTTVGAVTATARLDEMLLVKPSVPVTLQVTFASELTRVRFGAASPSVMLEGEIVRLAVDVVLLELPLPHPAPVKVPPVTLTTPPWICKVDTPVTAQVLLILIVPLVKSRVVESCAIALDAHASARPRNSIFFTSFTPNFAGGGTIGASYIRRPQKNVNQQAVRLGFLNRRSVNHRQSPLALERDSVLCRVSALSNRKKKEREQSSLSGRTWNTSYYEQLAAPPAVQKRCSL
ncbi:MAG: hypothetical protein ABI846_03845 [Rudaea sp.]